MLRIGMVSPYSLTIPGGVQQQVLGLARSLRAMGHEVRVLGPCDGPPPDPFVTPLGNSLPTVANGSIAPLAPDASAALRTIRALNDEAFDVLHVHEPLVPGPSLTALLVKMAPVVATFHSAGESAAYLTFSRQLKWIASRIDIRVAVSKDAVELAHRYIGGEYEVLFNGIELGDYLTPSSKQRENAIFFIGRHEERKGLSNLLEAMAMNLPVVASKLDGIAEVIEEGREGYLVDSADAAGFVERCAVLLENPAKSSELAANARTKIEARFSVERMTSAVESIYDRFLP